MLNFNLNNTLFLFVLIQLIVLFFLVHLWQPSLVAGRTIFMQIHLKRWLGNYLLIFFQPCFMYVHTYVYYIDLILYNAKLHTYVNLWNNCFTTVLPVCILQPRVWFLLDSIVPMCILSITSVVSIEFLLINTSINTYIY